MHEHFDDRQWLLYLDGALDPAASSGMWRHIESCRDCGRLFFSMTAVAATLREEAERLRDAALMSEESVEAMLERCTGDRKRRTPREAIACLSGDLLKTGKS